MPGSRRSKKVVKPMGNNHKARVHQAMQNLPNGRSFTVEGVRYIKRGGKAVKL